MSDDQNRQAYLKAIRQYYANEYVKLLNLGQNHKQFSKLLDNPNVNFWSHKNRIVANIQIMKHKYITNKTNIITACFKMTLDNTSCIYSYIHFRCEPGIKKNDALTPRFICTSPTYRSQDGEYRRRLIAWEQFVKLFAKYTTPFNEIEALALEKINAGRLTFHVDMYFPMGCLIDEGQVSEFINVNRLPIKLYILCWAYDFHNIHFNIIENHVHPAYHQIIYQKEDIAPFEKILKSMTQAAYWAMMRRIAAYKFDPNEPDYNLIDIECGQKIFPLTAIEAVKTDDINFNVWREIYIANMASNLALNLIAPNFPFINNWFYVQNAHAGLFDNLAMHEKYLHSAVAEDMSNQLKNIDKFNYVNANRDRGPISGKFFRLSKGIQKSIIYADSDIKLTDLAVCITSEYVGRTLRDLPSFIAYGGPDAGLAMVFSDIDTFVRHIFEFIYAFYCMNSKIGIIHGDLHMNNATIMNLYVMFTVDGKPVVDAPYILYLLEGIAFTFPHTGLFSMIIDFSRAIIGDYSKLEHEFGARYADMYFKEQRLRVLQIIYHYFPRLTEKYRDQIEGLLLNKFPLMFKILTVIDTYVIMSNIAAMFTIDNIFVSETIKIAVGAQKLLQSVIKHAEMLFTTYIQGAIDGRITGVNDIEWPNLTILKKEFPKYVVTAAQVYERKLNVVEIFNAMNNVVYDIEDYDTWGPLLSLDKEIELRKKFKQPIHIGIEQWIQYKRTDESTIIEALTSKYEQQEKEVLQFESWMLT